jgi:type I restriction enzyme, R subunit
VNFTKDLNREEERAVKEGLTEDELAIFDLLKKDNLNPDDVAKVRPVARELLEKLRTKLTPGWRDFEPLRAGVKNTIRIFLFPKLPEAVYSNQDCESKSLEVYNFVYERYAGARTEFANM